MRGSGKMVNFDNIGAIRNVLSKHVFSKELTNELDRFPNMTFIGLGQGGGRIASEFSRFDFPTYLVNSSKSDMEEHNKLIPEDRRIITSSTNFPELEGTAKNPKLGFEIAKENQEAYMNIALSEDVQNADFVWVTVSLGGGTGNGALQIALHFLSNVLQNKKSPTGKIPLGVICSLPSKDEAGSSFRENTLAAINLLQTLIDDEKIGSVLVIDNEKMTNYYADRPMEAYNGMKIDAKGYSNIVLAALLSEVATLPLLHGRSVFDKTEFLDIISTPGWLSFSKMSGLDEENNLEELVEQLYTTNSVLAQSDIKSSIIGMVGITYPSNTNVSPKTADDLYKYSSNILNTTVHLSISPNTKIPDITLYGVVVSSTAPDRISEIKTELIEWRKIEEEQRLETEKKREKLALGNFDDFYSNSGIVQRDNRNTSSLDDMFKDNPFSTPTVKLKDNKVNDDLITKDELDNFRF